MAGVVTNQNELLNIMKVAATKALNGITKEVIDIFKEEYIMKMIYEQHMPNVKYHADTRTPTYEFKNAWDWTPIKDDVTKLSTMLWYNPDKLNFNNETFLHGSVYSTPEDVRASLMIILDKRGRSSSLWLSSTANRKKAYWQEFIKTMFDNGGLTKIVTRHFLANGFIKS